MINPSAKRLSTCRMRSAEFGPNCLPTALNRAYTGLPMQLGRLLQWHCLQNRKAKRRCRKSGFWRKIRLRMQYCNCPVLRMWIFSALTSPKSKCVFFGTVWRQTKYPSVKSLGPWQSKTFQVRRAPFIQGKMNIWYGPPENLKT